MSKQKRSLKKISSFAGVLFFLFLAGAQTAFGQWNLGNYDSTKLPKNSLYAIIENIAKWLLSVFGFFAVIGFVVSGIMYLVASGDEDTQERAKRAMIYSITGVIVGLVGLIVIYAVDNIFKATSGTGGI
jgi:cytochrome bd-type quinol oxidase subunit 2